MAATFTSREKTAVLYAWLSFQEALRNGDDRLYDAEIQDFTDEEQKVLRAKLADRLGF